MLINNLKIATRNALKYKGYSAINLFGLVVGLASFIIIMLYVYDELSYDKFHKDTDRIYRLAYNQVNEDFKRHRNAIPGALENAMVSEIPEVEQATGLYYSGWGKALLANGKYTYYDEAFLYVGKSFFDIFSFQFIQGDAHAGFENPYSIVLTKSTAERFFGEQDALGQTLTFNQKQPLTVTGVIEDVPPQSHLQFDFLVSRTVANRPAWEDSWGQGHMDVYIKLRPGSNVSEVESKIQNIAKLNQKYYWESKNFREMYFTEPIAGMNGIHLSLPGNKLYVSVFLLVAFFILVIAGINYVNLATARSAIRAKEIGVRKVIGARRQMVIYQFLLESVLMAAIAGCIAIALAEIILPFFNDLMQKSLSLLTIGSLPIWGSILTAILVFGLAAGLYPAFYLSAFKPISILRKQHNSKQSVFNFRKVLVVSQFALSIFFLIGMIVVKQQVFFMHSASLGFDKDNVLVIKNFHKTPRWGDPDFVVRDALEEIPGVIRVGGATESMLGLRGLATGMMRRNSTSPPIPSLAQLVDVGYFEALGLEFVEGRNFSPQFADDLQWKNVIVNETAVRKLGITGSAVGKTFGEKNEKTIIGVVKDFHPASLHHEILPYTFLYNREALFTVVVKLAGGSIRETIKQMENVWAGFVPDYPLDYYFLDEALDKQYRTEQNFNSFFSVMTGLVIVIACLGLLGLIAYTAEQRTREIGIRKVLGATVANVVALLSTEFVKLVLLANVVAWPIAYFAMTKWLANFAYRIDIGFWTFALAGISALMIAAITVGFQAFKAATANPVESLSYE